MSSAESDADSQPEPAQVALGDLGDLADGEMRCFPDVGEFGIVVCRVEGVLHALDDNCSHADTPLSEGRFRGATITCPLHGAQFDVRDGSHKTPPAYEGVQSHRVAETPEGVLVAIAKPGDDRGDGFGEVGGRFRTR